MPTLVWAPMGPRIKSAGDGLCLVRRTAHTYGMIPELGHFAIALACVIAGG
ncbi:hypothetical protein [Acidisoma cladoniae]|uniref:hypothetical protein n=1 Tax=Acidisoma cladoniae TaxID=3040935 RepID=UPI002550C91D|nr:hypothetical protein [Acidisoma sp. PAMC 29798]